jgi:hypothetical protein
MSEKIRETDFAKSKPKVSKDKNANKPSEKALADAALSSDQRLRQAESDLQVVRSMYEQYFLGIIKREPVKEHQRFKDQLRNISNNDLKTTALKFKYQAVYAQYIQLNQMWGKVLRQIEEGTYKRDLFLLDKKVKATQDKTKSPAAGKPAATAATHDTKLEKLYETMQKMAPNQKLPDKNKFLGGLQKQLNDFRTKNPGRGVEIKLGKDAEGKIQVKIKAKEK